MKTITFVALLTLWTDDGEPPVVFVLGSGLSGAECVAQMTYFYGTELEDNVSCEFDQHKPERLR